MYGTFHLKASELDENLIRKIKNVFGEKNISITIEEDIDETDYLLSNPENKKLLKKSLEEAKAGKLIEIDLEHLK
ncbi:MAG: hypothetical protein WCH34_09645 [Bacteroidota bacterium]